MAAFDAGNLDETIHGRLRLGVMAYLAAASPATFTELARALSATNGNLFVHLKKLEDAGYITVEKADTVGRGVTRIAMTVPGREAWAHYLRSLRQLFEGGPEGS